MDFQQRLDKAVERGQRANTARSQADSAKALSEEECKRLHSQYRLKLSEHIERCVAQLAQHFPGFRQESVVGDRGWGSALSRDDLSLDGGKRNNYFSRLEVSVRPFSSFHVLDLAAKGTIKNKEVYNRNFYQLLSTAELDTFTDLVDAWVLEYAELFAAQR